MTNEEAIDLLDEFAEMASNVARVATWAQAFLQEGGEPTWDAVKSVSRMAATLGCRCETIRTFEDIYEDIFPL